jgi:transposase
VSLAYGRLLHQSPLKNMFFHYSHSFLSETFSEVDLSPKRIGLFLKELGYERDKMVSYFREFKKSEDCILFDGTDIFSASEQMDLPKLAKSKIGTFDTVISIMCVFSIKQQLPVYYRLLPGNIKDVKSFTLCLMESQIKDVIVIIDKGFTSDKNIASLENEKLKYIIPLPGNSRYIDYQKITDGDKRKFDGYFRFENRFIWYYSNVVEGKKVNVYLDEELRNREQRDYLNRIENRVDNFSIEKFHEK